MPIRLKISHDLQHKNRYKRFFVYNQAPRQLV
jgi:hypothetical protein